MIKNSFLATADVRAFSSPYISTNKSANIGKYINTKNVCMRLVTAF